jgi:hypothetical protein
MITLATSHSVAEVGHRPITEDLKEEILFFK